MTTRTAAIGSAAATTSRLTISAPVARPQEDAYLHVRSTWTEPWSRRMDDLYAIRLLDDDWDGQRAKAPSAALIDSAIQLAEVFRQCGIDAPCRIVPGVNGTVIFEWQDGDVYRELEVTHPYQAEMLEMIPGQPTQYWNLTPDQPIPALGS